MIVTRVPPNDMGITCVYIFSDEDHERAGLAYQVWCAEFDYDGTTNARIPPSARISLLGTNTLHWEDVRRLADDYAVVAHIAMQLESEKRAAYAERYGTHPRVSSNCIVD